LLYACERARVGKVVATSSSAVFGVPASNPVLPETPPMPADRYGRAKLDAELVCRAAVTRGLDVSIVRPRPILGMRRRGVFAILFDWIAAGSAVPVPGSGANRYQAVHADDLASACILAADRSGPGSYNIGAEQFGTLRDAVEHLCAHAGTGAHVRSVPVAVTAKTMRLTAQLGLTPFDADQWITYSKELWFDLHAAQESLGWKPVHSTDAALRDSYDLFISDREAARLSGTDAANPATQGILRLAKRLFR
ncbi:MAG: NAD-dependent epimerase/dehydratase family protein, partial [Nocardioidaceae bacterium]